jgi:group I intron endonuclease
MQQSSGGAIYMIWHRESTRAYIGLTTQAVEKRWGQHRSDADKKRNQTYIGHALRKYGPDAFDWLVLESGIALDDTRAREAHYVRVLRANQAGHGFNLTAGGEAAPSSDPRVRAKISASSKGRKLTDEWKRRVGDAIRGRKAGPAQRAAIDRTGTKATPETIERLRVSHTGKTASAETRARMAVAQRARRAANDSDAKKVGESTKRLWADPEHRAMRLEKLRAAWAANAASGATKAAAAKRVLTPELRAIYAEAARKRWAKAKESRNS